MGAMGLVALIFLWVIMQAGKTADSTAGRRANRSSNTARRWVFAALLTVFAGVSWASLHNFPIPNQHGPLDAKQVVDVIGRQWSWQFSTSTLNVGTPVEFRVTSADVNHGFGIYDPDGHMLIQTQAMPGFTNKLLYTFTQPGTYKVMCLEFCGVGHAPMVAEFNVVAAKGE